MTKTDILIIGGGIIGVSCAYYLARAGCSVRLIEKDTVGAGASHGNCGLIYVSDLPPLCLPGTVPTELKRMWAGSSPLVIRPTARPDRYRWLTGFALNCNRRHRDWAMRVRNDLLQRSKSMYQQLFKDEHMDCEWHARGVLVAIKKSESMRAYAQFNDLLKPYALDARPYDRAEMQALEPALRDDVIGGYHHESDAHLRPEALMRQWRVVLETAGVQIEEHCDLRRFSMAGNRARLALTNRGAFAADRFIVAAGAWSSRICRSLGVFIPVEPGKGYSVTMQRPRVCPATICYLYEKSMVVTPWPSGLRLGGTMEFAGMDFSRRADRLNHLMHGAAEYLKMSGSRRVMERWAGLRPMSADDLPVVDWLPGLQNVMVATGHGMLGLSLAPATGQLVTEMTVGQPHTIDPAWLGLGRFNFLGRAAHR